MNESLLGFVVNHENGKYYSDFYDRPVSLSRADIYNKRNAQKQLKLLIECKTKYKGISPIYLTTKGVVYNRA